MRKRLHSIVNKCTAVLLVAMMAVGGLLNDGQITAHAASTPTIRRSGIMSVDGYDYLLDYEKATISNCTLTSSNGKWHTKQMSADTSPHSVKQAVYYDGTVSGSGSLPGVVTMRWSNAATDGAGAKYDLVVTIQNIAYNMSVDSATQPVILKESYETYGANDKLCLVSWFSADAVSRQNFGRFGIRFDVTYKLVRPGTDTVVNGKMLMAWSDMDQPGVDASYNGGQSNFAESIKIVSGLASDVYVEPDTVLNISSDNSTFAATVQTEDQKSENRSGIAMLGDARGTTVTWAGSDCGTYMITNVGGKFIKYNQTVRVRYQQKDGSWTGYTSVIDNKPVLKGMSFWYDWEPSKDKPENVYANVGKVGTNSVMSNHTYDVDVPRKQYTYSFDVNPPSRHNAREIGNQQSNVTRYAENAIGDVKSPTLNGYTFLGWSKSKMAAATDKASYDKAKAAAATVASSTKMLSSKTFYAVWVKKPTMTFVDGTGHTLTTSTLNVGTNATVPATPTRYGYTFTGWKGSYNNVYSDTTVTAQWIKNPIVTFTDGFGNTLKTEMVQPSGSATAPSNPSKKGYVYKGWDKPFTNVTKDITVNAKWSINKIIVTVPTKIAYDNMNVGNVSTSDSFDVTVDGDFSGNVTVSSKAGTLKNRSGATLNSTSLSGSTPLVFAGKGKKKDTISIKGLAKTASVYEGTVSYFVDFDKP